MAQDKRHDLAPHALRFWVAKLRGFSDRLITRALRQGRWEFFPSVDDVILLMEQIQERDVQDAGSGNWKHYQERQKYAEENGLLATDEDYAYMRKRLRELFGDPTAKQTGRTA